MLPKGTAELSNLEPLAAEKEKTPKVKAKVKEKTKKGKEKEKVSVSNFVIPADAAEVPIADSHMMGPKKMVL